MRPDESKVSRRGVSSCECEVAAPTSVEDFEKKKKKNKRAVESPLMTVLESWLLFLLPSGILFR